MISLTFNKTTIAGNKIKLVKEKNQSFSKYLKMIVIAYMVALKIVVVYLGIRFKD